MITGDMYGAVGTLIAKLYGEAMQSNLVQMPHHGAYKDDNGDLWKNVLANYILWPVSEGGIEARWNITYGEWVKTNLLNNDMNSDKCFWAKFDTVVFDLPFTGKNFTRTENAYYANSVVR